MAEKLEVGGEEKTSSTNKTKKIEDTDIIKVKSLVNSVYYTCPKTNDLIIWSDAGDIQEMTFAQLKVMKSRHIGYFAKKWLIPQDENAIKKLGIADLLTGKFDRGDMQLLYGNNLAAVKDKISILSDKDKKSLAEKIVKGVKQEKIVNIKIIRYLEKEFGLDLMSLV